MSRKRELPPEIFLDERLALLPDRTRLTAIGLRANADNWGRESAIALMEALIEKAPEGVIVDPFAGTAATLIAARNLGRKSIGIERDAAYCDAAVRRIASEPARLFSTPQGPATAWSAPAFDFEGIA